MPIRLPEGTGCIINKPTNEHWIAQAKINGKILTYDSYGRSMGPNSVKVIPYFKQHDPEMDCGSRSLAWLYDTITDSK